MDPISGFLSAFRHQCAGRCRFVTWFDPVDPAVTWGEVYYWGRSEVKSVGEYKEQEGIKHIIADWLPEG